MWGALLAQGIGAIAGAFGALSQGKSQASAYKAQSYIDEANAKRAAMDASYNEDVQRRQMYSQLADMRGAMAEKGLDSGSFDKLYEQSADNGLADVYAVRQQGLSEWQNYKLSASQNRLFARQAIQTGKANAWGNVAKGAADLLATKAMYSGNKLSGSNWDKKAAEQMNTAVKDVKPLKYSGSQKLSLL